ncbi:hypothetical protein EAE99_009648 [Botrytis elliptica]|nr:hypothetical protein EAE99_009648 [Botrytis elliptica]
MMNKPLPAGTTMTDVMKRNALFVKHVKFLDNQQMMVRKQLYNAIRKMQIQESIICTAPAEIRSKLLNGQKLFGQLQAEIACGQCVAINTRRIHHLHLSLQRLYRRAVDSQRQRQRQCQRQCQRQQARRSNAPSPSTVSIETPPPPYSAN